MHHGHEREQFLLKRTVIVSVAEKKLCAQSFSCSYLNFDARLCYLGACRERRESIKAVRKSPYQRGRRGGRGESLGLCSSSRHGWAQD